MSSSEREESQTTLAVPFSETDRMGITHHSNYVRWMEEARTFFLREIGWPYEKIEEEGIISPVTSISCDYKATSTFGMMSNTHSICFIILDLVFKNKHKNLQKD